jgi:hypothetical protein
MTDIEERLRNIQTQLSQETSRRARDEVEEENATKAVAEIRAQLESDFGVKTSADLAVVKRDLEEQLEAAVAEAEEKLAVASEARPA